jgi:hypothetical protein
MLVIFSQISIQPKYLKIIHIVYKRKNGGCVIFLQKNQKKIFN